MLWLPWGSPASARDDALRRLDRRAGSARGAGASPATGLVVLAAYELFSPPPAGAAAGLPLLAAWRVDASVSYRCGAPPRLTVAGPGGPLESRGSCGSGPPAPEARATPREPARACGAPRTSLPRARYLRAVERLRRHIAAGDIYQANLCQRLDVACRGDAFESWAALVARAEAPHAAWLEGPGFALASISPETFLRSREAGRIETWPIKGTRARGATPDEDRRAAEELVRSAKDRAELLMIVDLERNDLSRVCRPGTVTVEPLAALRSFPTVHHLVAGVHGELDEGVGLGTLLRASFPGGSITGAPKIRAMQLLREIEEVPRGLFTGSLLWCGDDGRIDSSILIRTLVFRGGRAYLGAGGGIVADSSPEREWEESNLKARALAAALGFEPEEAT